MFVVANILWLVERRHSERFRKGWRKGSAKDCGAWSRLIKRLILFFMWLPGVVLIAQRTATVTSTQTLGRAQAGLTTSLLLPAAPPPA